MNRVKSFTILLNLFSALLTGIGFFTVLEGQAVQILGETFGLCAAVALAGALSVAVQGLLHTLWWRAGLEGILHRPINLSAGVVMSAISWFGSAGGTLLVASYADLLAEQQRNEAAASSVPLRAFAIAYADLRADVGSLARTATELSETETRVGGTCHNDRQPTDGCGPRCRLRQRHAADLGGVEAVAAALEIEARDISIGLSMAQDYETQRSYYADAVRLQGNAEQRRIADRLSAMARDLTGPVTDPRTGQEFVCKDAKFSARLEALALHAAARVELPDVGPRMQSVDISDALTCVAARVGELAGVSAPCPGGRRDGPLLWALALEILIVTLLVAETARLRGSGAVPTEAERFQRAGGKNKSKEELEECRWLMQGASVYIVEAGRRGRFIAAPVDGSIQAHAEATRLARYFGEVTPAHVSVPLADIEPGWTLARGPAFEDARLFNLYHWPPDADLRVRQAERDLASSSPAS